MVEFPLQRGDFAVESLADRPVDGERFAHRLAPSQLRDHCGTEDASWTREGIVKFPFAAFASSR